MKTMEFIYMVYIDEYTIVKKVIVSHERYVTVIIGSRIWKRFKKVQN